MQKNNNFNFDEIPKGYKGTVSLTISNQMIDDYIQLSGDNSAIHLNKELANKAGFSDRVMHGSLLNSIFSSIVGTKIPGDSALILEMRTRFNNPIYPNDIIQINFVVLEKHPSVSCIILKIIAKNQNGVITGTSRINIKVR